MLLNEFYIVTSNCFLKNEYLMTCELLNIRKKCPDAGESICFLAKSKIKDKNDLTYIKCNKIFKKKLLFKKDK